MFKNKEGRFKVWLGAIAVACFIIPTGAFLSDLFSCTYLKIAQPRASKRAAMRSRNKQNDSSYIPGCLGYGTVARCDLPYAYSPKRNRLGHRTFAIIHERQQLWLPNLAARANSLFPLGLNFQSVFGIGRIDSSIGRSPETTPCLQVLFC